MVKGTKNTAPLAAIVKGINRARDLNYGKPMDIAVAILTNLDNAGLEIVRKPRKRD
jgi:hypothetical protein